MKVAFAVWNHRIAPVFDVAQHIHLAHYENDVLVREAEARLPVHNAMQKVQSLVELGVELLICGAVSRPLHEMLAAYGIQVIPFVAGELQQVMSAWHSGALQNHSDFLMPGCCRRHKGPNPFYDKNTEVPMFGRKGGGQGGGGGQGQGRGAGRGRMGGPLSSGPSGECVCPQCGHRTAHQRGTPCTAQTCPKCGASMTRG